MGDGSFKVCLTTSGTGSRLGELTKDRNKAVIDINGQPSVSYIIERYPTDAEFVVTLGFLGAQVRDCLLARYPERHFTFVEVDKYVGQGSSLGYSMLCAQENLQAPFVFHACDTIVTDPIPPPTENWIAGYQTGDSIHYRTLNIQGDQVLYINDKGAENFDYIHIGLVGIHNYADFWRHMGDLYRENPHDEALNDTFALNRMFEQGIRFKHVPMSAWYDTGNPQALAESTRALAAQPPQ
jgi:NDP-sugar pyrophosphorylase family protein